MELRWAGGRRAASIYLAVAVAASPAGIDTWRPVAGATPAQAPVPGHPLTGNSMPAVWKEQHVDFLYMGRTSWYSCDGLRNKVRAMLLDLGARRDLQIVPLDCADYSRAHTRSPAWRLKIIFSSPALPDAAAKPLREGDLAATDARFEEFTITSDAFRNMGIGDCELVQEFSHQLLTKLATRNVRQDIRCAPDPPGGNRPAGPRWTGPRFLVRGEVLKTSPGTEQIGSAEGVRGS
jgi:hypothetical protein